MKNIYKVNEEAVKKIAERVYDNGSTVINRNDLEEMFPELKESEDERIRKKLLSSFKCMMTDADKDELWYGLSYNDIIAWLEKQVIQDNTEDVDILHRFSFYSYKDEPNVLYLSGLYMNEEYRNKGIGTKILKVADEVAKSLDCYTIRLKTKKDSDAERLYQTHGYNSLSTEGKDEIWLEKQSQTFTKKDVDDAYLKGVTNTKNEIEKQYEANYQIRKDIATFIFNYRGDIKDRAKWIDYLGIKVSFVEKQGEHKETLCDKCKKEQPSHSCQDITALGRCALEKQGEQKLTPIFRIGDTIIAKDGTYIEKEPFHIDRIEDDCYWDGENTILVCNQDEFEIFKKPADKVEPKFHKGEWLCENEPNNYARFIQILEIVNVQGKDRYRISRDLHNDEDVVECRFIENNYHSFNIQDAKAGDVLAAHECLVLFKEIDGLNIRCYCTYHYMNHQAFYVDTLQNKTAFHPATKEQRDTLMKAMTDAGYTFDFEKKELKKIEQKPTEWSEEDEKMINSIAVHLNATTCGFPEDRAWADRFMNWLNSIKDRVQSQPKQEWREEDEATLDNLIWALKEDMVLANDRDEYINWLKSFKNKVCCKANCTTIWKPSEEQMVALKHYVDTTMDGEIDLLYQDLKKLMEE